METTGSKSDTGNNYQIPNMTDLDRRGVLTKLSWWLVWIDSNKNGLQDTDEEGVIGIKVYLLDGDGNRLKMRVVVILNRDDRNGQYIFEGLKPKSMQLSLT